MPEKVARLGIEREEGFVYYLKRGEVWRAAIAPETAGGGPPRKERIADPGVAMDPAYIYFLDRDGDLARAERSPR